MPKRWKGLRTEGRRGSGREPAPAKAAELELLHALSRREGTVAAYRGAVSLLLAAQLVLWLFAAGDGAHARTLWQAALLLLLPGLGVWAVSRAVWSKESLTRPWEKLLLLPCLLLDAVTLLHALLSLLTRLMPSYPAGILRAAIPLLLAAGTLLGRSNGAAYGAALWRRALLIPAALLVWRVIVRHGSDSLFPILGDGIPATLRMAAGGLGSLWPIAALFAVPPAAPARKAAGLSCALVPLGGACLLALALCCAAPWLMGTQAAMGDRLLRLGRSSGSIAVSGLAVGLWLILLMLGWCVSLHCACRIAGEVFPGSPGWLPPVTLAAVSAASLWFWQDGLPPWVMALLPWRLLLWAAAAVWGGFRCRRKGHPL